MQKNRSKKFIFLFCVIVVIVLGSDHRVRASVVPSGEEQQENYAKWVYDDRTHCLTISGNGETHDEELTSENEGEWIFNNDNLVCYDLSESKEKLFQEIRNSVQEIVVEQGVTAINYAAFSECINVKKVILPDSVKKINKYSFWKCKSLKEIIIPDSVTSLGKRCFSGCKSLKKLVLGKSVASIGDGSFCECRSLRKIVVNSENHDFMTKNGCLYQVKKKILYFSYVNSQKVSIEKGTRQIGTCAFAYHDRMQEVKIPASVTVIGGGAFYQCKNLKEVVFAKKSRCREIKDYGWVYADDDGEYGCFEKCKKIRKIKFPESLQYVNGTCFKQCTSLEELYFGKKFKGYHIDEKGYKSFKFDPIKIRIYRLSYRFIQDNSKLKNVGISKKNTYFCNKDGLLYDKKMTILYFCPQGKTGIKLMVPKSVKIINCWAFDLCKKIRSIVIQGKNTEIDSTAFKSSGHIVLYGKKNSKAQKYAKKHKMKFVVL